MGQLVVSAFQAQFVPQGVNFFRLRLDPVGGFCQIIAQRNRRFPLVPLRPFCVLTQRIYEILTVHNSPPNFIKHPQKVCDFFRYDARKEGVLRLLPKHLRRGFAFLPT